MRTITETKDVYTYAELNDDAKEAVRQWYSEGQWNDGIAQESMQLICDGMLEDAGFEPSTELYYSDLYSQGGYPQFATRGLHSHAGVKYTLIVTTEHSGGGSYYMHTELLDGEGNELPWYEISDDEKAAQSAAEHSAKDRVHALSSKMFWAFREEDEYMSSDEQVAEMCEANEWEFDENGRLA